MTLKTDPELVWSQYSWTHFWLLETKDVQSCSQWHAFKCCKRNCYNASSLSEKKWCFTVGICVSSSFFSGGNGSGMGVGQGGGGQMRLSRIVAFFGSENNVLGVFELELVLLSWLFIFFLYILQHPLARIMCSCAHQEKYDRRKLKWV